MDSYNISEAWHFGDGIILLIGLRSHSVHLSATLISDRQHTPNSVVKFASSCSTPVVCDFCTFAAHFEFQAWPFYKFSLLQFYNLSWALGVVCSLTGPFSCKVIDMNTIVNHNTVNTQLYNGHPWEHHLVSIIMRVYNSRVQWKIMTQSLVMKCLRLYPNISISF